MKLVLAFCLCLSSSWSLSPLKNLVLVDNMYNMTADPPLFKDRIGVRKLVQKNGAVLHTYRVTTVEGYILQLNHFILKTEEEMSALPGKGTPVILLHGLFATFDIWLIDGKEMDLPFLLAEQGLDVWLPDKRGNYFSRLHETLSKDDAKFWNYTAHEPGVYDLPAFVDAVVEITKRPKLIFIGHSAACVDFLVMASFLPEYNDKFLFSIQMAAVPPSFSLDYVSTSYIRIGLNNLPHFNYWLDRWSIHEFLPRRQSFIDWVLKHCGKPPMQEYCIDLFDVGSGPHRLNIDRSRIAVQMSRWPAGCGRKAAVHIAQMTYNGFRQFDYGAEKNLELYGTEKPPPYNLLNIVSPVVFIYGRNDPASAGLDVEQLKADIPSLIMAKAVPDPGFNHIDYVFGMNRRTVLYDDLVQMVLNLTHKYSDNSI